MTDTATTNASNSPYQESPASIARGWINRAVHDIVTATDGETGFTARPAYDGDPWPNQEPNALPALRATIMVRNVAETTWRTAIATARGAGTSWQDIAGILGINADDHGSPAETAFELTAEPPNRFGEIPPVYWRCHTCDAWVSDSGPYESHPADNVTGHAEGCTRYAAELAAWHARNPN